MTTYKINTPGPTPPEPWTPGANTIAYFPFTEDSLDKTGNYTLNSSGTKETIGYKFNTPTTVTGGSIPGVNFIGFWYNTHDANLSGNYDLCAYAGHGYIAYNPGHNLTSIRGKMVIFSDTSYNLGGSIDINKYDSWHYLARSYDGSKIIVCDDGVVSTLYNNGGYNFGNGFTLNNYGTGGSGSTARTTFSELIIEDTGWSSEDMTKYYNDTKANYGIS